MCIGGLSGGRDAFHGERVVVEGTVRVVLDVAPSEPGVEREPDCLSDCLGAARSYWGSLKGV
jgi:hypothetical protein